MRGFILDLRTLVSVVPPTLTIRLTPPVRWTLQGPSVGSATKVNCRGEIQAIT